MNKHAFIFVLLTIITCLLPLMSGCTEQNNSTKSETIQTILEKAAILETVSYKIDTEFLVNGAVQQTTTIHVWQKQPYLKEEESSTAGNITTTRTVIQRPEGLYRYDNESQSYELDTQLIIPQPSTVDMVSNLLNNQTLTIIGTETIDGKTTTVIQYSPDQVDESTIITLWIWNEKGVPLQERYTMENEEITVIIYSQYSNYSFEDIPDSLFSVS